jgi:hypothetical protein
MSEQPGRYQRSASGMVAALLVTVLAIAAYVLLRGVFSRDLDEKPTRVDYLADVRYAQQSGVRVVYPAPLPASWIPTNSDYAPGKRASFGVSILTADNQYVGTWQSPEDIPQLLTDHVDANPKSGDAVDIPGALVTHWDTWTDSGGDTALTAKWHGESLMVFGSADLGELEQVVKLLKTDTVK